MSRTNDDAEGYFDQSIPNQKKNTGLRRVIIIALIIEILIIIISNILIIRGDKNSLNHLFRVEAKHVADELQHIAEKAEPDSDLSGSIDLSKYETIKNVSLFNPSEAENHEYVVKEVNGKLYRIEYEEPNDSNAILFMNIGLGSMFIFTVVLLIFIDRRISRPFIRMSNYANELARGNLSTPVTQEKSRYFGQFMWGMDMLREQLEADREREHEYMRERKTLLLSLSHDIKTPLSAIELYNKALSTGLYDTDEKRNEAYNGIEKNVGDLRRYVNEINEASRQDFLALKVRDGEFYMADVIEAVERYYSDRFQTLHTPFSIDEYPNPLLKGDPDRVVEVMQNLLENAIKYGDGRRVEIHFSTEEDEDAELIHVHNTGESLPDGEIVHVFDSFYRGSNAEGVNGSGLGLYIAKELMMKMDGDVYVESDDGFTAVVVLRRA